MPDPRNKLRKALKKRQQAFKAADKAERHADKRKIQYDAARMFRAGDPQLAQFLEAAEVLFNKPGDAEAYRQDPARLKALRRLEKNKKRIALREVRRLERKIVKQARRVDEHTGQQFKEYFNGPPPIEDWDPDIFPYPNPDIPIPGPNPNVNIDGHGRRKRKTVTHGRSKRK